MKSQRKHIGQYARRKERLYGSWTRFTTMIQRELARKEKHS